MTDEKKENKCKCSLGIGIVVLILGLFFGLTGNSGFGWAQILTVIAGVVLIFLGLKKTGLCKCCDKK